MKRGNLPQFVIGAILGGLTNEFWQRHHRRAFSDAVERGDFEEAQKHVRRYYWSDIFKKLRRPPPETDDQE